MAVKIPRLVIAGLSGDSGKTVVSLSLVAALKNKGLSVSVFKKGPDYIDSAWLGEVADNPCRNLDTFMVQPNDVLTNFGKNAEKFELAVIEGNRGLFDGKDESGMVSTAELAKLLQAPLVLVVNATKTTRTIAAIIKGCLDFDSELNIAGVVLNKVAGKRHESVIRKSIEKYCGIPVFGVIPKLGKDKSIIPGRHLGLVTPAEFDTDHDLNNKLNEIAESYLAVDDLIEIAKSAKQLEYTSVNSIRSKGSDKVTIGYFKDSVFTFYYPENLEALEKEGARLVPISSIDDMELPDIDALYIGGGFPETQADRLISNKSMMTSVKNAAEEGLPIYAECGGLIYLSQSIIWNDEKHDMAGLLPVELQMNKKPAGHGYTVLRVDNPNPFFEIGTKIIGHEFHYSSPVIDVDTSSTCMSVESGSGIGNNRDGLVYKNCLASYTHIHADGVKNWASTLVQKAHEYKEEKKTGNFKIAI